LLVLALMVAPAAQVLGQQPESRERIGLVLSGGSALGLAHVGVIKWLEEHRVPIDLVTGTSMGGLIGGMYASGYSAREMEEFLLTVNWDRTLQVVPEYRELSFRRKEDRNEFPNKFELGLRRGFALPSGLSPGHGVGLVISRVAAPYGELRDFNELPTPFRCVATDLNSGQEVVFESGDFFEALRATMSIPGVFAPVRRGDQLLVDGGLLNNLPVDVARRTGAQRVIAVTLELRAEKETGEPSLVSVAGRAINLMVAANEKRNLVGADLVLAPDLTGLAQVDFDRAEEFFRRGYEAAAKKAPFLLALAVSEAEWQAHQAERQRRRRQLEVRPAEIVIEGTKGEAGAALARELSGFANRPLETPKLERALTWITGTGRYDSAHFRIRWEDGRPILAVRVHEKSYAPPILNAMFDIDGTEVDNVRFGLAARITLTDFGGTGSDWRTDVRIGSNNRIATEYYWRIPHSSFFLAPHTAVDYSTQWVYSRKTRVADYREERLLAGIDLGLALGRFHEVRAGYEISRINAFTSVGTPLLPRLEGNFQTFRFKYAFEGLDNPAVPRRGFAGRLTARWIFDSPFAGGNYPIFDAQITAARPVSPRYHLLALLAGGTTAGNSTALPPFALGGPLRLSALARSQIRGENYYYSGLFVLRSLANRELTFFGRTYLGAGYEIGDAFSDVRRSNPFQNATVGLFSETPLGAVFIGGSVGEYGERKIFFRIGKLL
jgi:NTE family protein